MSVNQAARELQLRQIDQSVGRWREAALPKPPPVGWARAIREALCMSARALGERMGLSVTGVHKLESNEANGTITLASLRKLAEALDCELQYALVPRRRLEDVILERAREVASAELKSVAHTMALEDQKVSESERRAQVETHARALIARGAIRQLW